MGIHHSKLVASTASDNGTRCTLVSLLLREEWDLVCERLEQHPKEALVEVGLNPAAQFVPLHLACGSSNVPLRVIQALVKADPEGPLRMSSLTTSSSKRKARVRSMSQSSRDGSILESDSCASGTLSSATGGACSLSSRSVLRGELGGWLPLHVAVHFGTSLEVIQLLVETCPSSLLCKNGQGYLPLHLACQRASEDISRLDVVALLLETFPTSRFIPASCENGKTALELIQEKGDVPSELVELLQGRRVSGVNPPSPRSHRHSISRSDVVVQSIQSDPSTPKPRVWKLLKQSLGRTRDPKDPMKLVVLVTSRRWTDMLDRLANRPREAQVWTLCNAPRDPPCHSLPLHMALRRAAPLNVIQALVENYPESIHTREFYGMLPFHVACQAGCTLDVVQYLAERHPGAVRAPDLTGLLPLHLACLSEGCRNPVITFLLDAYPDGMLLKDDKGFLAEDYIRSGNHPRQRSILSEFAKGVKYWGAIPTELGKLLCHRQWDAAVERLDTYPHEATVWTKHPIHGRRRFALHMACRGKAPSYVVERLLEVSPETTQVVIDDFQLTPLHLAAHYGGSISTVQALLRVSPDTASCPDLHGLLPLHLAITEDACFDVVQALVKAYPQGVSARDSKGFTPVVYAESSFHPRSKMVLDLLRSVDNDSPGLKDRKKDDLKDGEETTTTVGDEASGELTLTDRIPRSVTVSSR